MGGNTDNAPGTRRATGNWEDPSAFGAVHDAVVRRIKTRDVGVRVRLPDQHRRFSIVARLGRSRRIMLNDLAEAAVSARLDNETAGVNIAGA